MTPKQHRERYKKFLCEKADLSQETKCLNILQKTAWRINRNVYDVLVEIWGMCENRSVAGLPTKTRKEGLQYPAEFEGKSKKDLAPEQKVKYKRWAAKAQSIREFNNTQTGRGILVANTLAIAKDYLEVPEFYFIWNCDFRWRKYPLSIFLQPQSSEWTKAILEFSRHMVMHNEEEAMWLYIHTANCYGKDKLTIPQRVQWVKDNTQLIKMVAADPIGNLELWEGTDKPFMFLATCFELAAFWANGNVGETRIPCAADGTSNGLQHLSAILRDERGGRAVNLTNNPEPADIYREVAADATVALLNDTVEAEWNDTDVIAQEVAEDVSDALYGSKEWTARENFIGRQWLKYGLDRKITKRAVMIIPYSGTQQAVKKYIKQEYMESIEEMRKQPICSDDEVNEFCQFLTKVVWQSIGKIITSSRLVMKYFQEMSSLYSSVDQFFWWKTPTGAWVQPMYFENKINRIQTNINGSLYSPAVYEETPQIDRRKLRSSVSPNVIHSLDASALTLTVNTAHDIDGIVDFMMIHDSYGTHSPNMPILALVLREQFAEMYINNDIMEQMYRQAIADLVPLGISVDAIPQPPPKGNLDINEVLESDYFFS